MEARVLDPEFWWFSMEQVGPRELLVIWGHIPAQGSGSHLKKSMLLFRIISVTFCVW